MWLKGVCLFHELQQVVERMLDFVTHDRMFSGRSFQFIGRAAFLFISLFGASNIVLLALRSRLVNEGSFAARPRDGPSAHFFFRSFGKDFFDCHRGRSHPPTIIMHI
jgi:hypothetical protein